MQAEIFCTLQRAGGREMCKARYREMLTKGLRGKRGALGQAIKPSILGALLAYAGRQHRRVDASPTERRAACSTVVVLTGKYAPRTRSSPPPWTLGQLDF